MSNYRLGFIGMGNMGQALCAGFIRSGKIAAADAFAADISAYTPHFEKCKKTAETIGFAPCRSLQELAERTDIFVMACKPYQIEGVLAKMADVLPGKAIVSVAAGWDFETYQAHLPENVRVQFVMPNTPVMVSEGVSLFEERNSLLPDERAWLMELFAAVGAVEELPSHLMGIGGVVTGCAPAFVDLFIESYADAAVKYGIPRQTAYRLISQMVAGSARLQLETGTHPGILKDNVCSPAGTTICGVAALEEAGFRSACIKSVDAVMDKK